MIISHLSSFHILMADWIAADNQKLLEEKHREVTSIQRVQLLISAASHRIATQSYRRTSW